VRFPPSSFHGGAVPPLLLALGVLLLVTAGCTSRSDDPQATEETAVLWTCSMHPSVRLLETGICPLCSMELIPMKAASSTGDGLRLSERARRLARVRTVEVIRGPAEVEINLSGRITYDETRVRTLTAWSAGRLEKLHVDASGVRIHEGEHLVDLYSPELVAARKELVQAIVTAREIANNGSAQIRGYTAANIEAAREKLQIFGLSPGQIDEIETTALGSGIGDAREKGTRKGRLTATINAPISGVVIEKYRREGEYVKVGDPIYTIANLDRVWVMLDAFEADIGKLRYGQHVVITIPALPGREVHGTIELVDWDLDEKTRTAGVRIGIDNPSGVLRPGLLVEGKILVTLSADGGIRAPDLGDVFTCSMHPEVRGLVGADCPRCKMRLIPARAFTPEESVGNLDPLLIPSTAPLLTGRRAVVYIAEELDSGDELYQLREIELGPRAGGNWVVLDGLEEGERVVARGAFRIDGSLQLEGRAGLLDVLRRAGEPEAVSDDYPLDNCVVTGLELGSMGEPAIEFIDGIEVRFCCSGCVPKAKADPERYLAELRNALDENDSRRENR